MRPTTQGASCSRSCASTAMPPIRSGKTLSFSTGDKGHGRGGHSRSRTPYATRSCRRHTHGHPALATPIFSTPKGPFVIGEGQIPNQLGNRNLGVWTGWVAVTLLEMLYPTGFKFTSSLVRVCVMDPKIAGYSKYPEPLTSAQGPKGDLVWRVRPEIQRITDRYLPSLGGQLSLSEL